MSTPENTIARIRDFIHDQFPLAQKRKVSITDSLLESGVIDSMGTLEVVDFLESEFDLEVTDEEMVADHFESIASIADLVTSKSHGGRAEAS